jgi:hypothetical protein
MFHRIVSSIKSTTPVKSEDCDAVNSFAKDIPDASLFCVSRDPHAKIIGAT